MLHLHAFHKRVFMQILKLQYYNLRVVSGSSMLCIICNARLILTANVYYTSKQNEYKSINWHGACNESAKHIINNGQVCATLALIVTPSIFESKIMDEVLVRFL